MRLSNWLVRLWSRMRILLDECLPAEFADELKGHDVSTVQQEGWSGLENGALLEQASRGFSVFITVDKHDSPRLI